MMYVYVCADNMLGNRHTNRTLLPANGHVINDTRPTR